MLCPMPLRKPFGFVLFLLSWTFQSLILFPFLATTKQRAHCQTPLPFLPAPSTSIFGIILFGNTYNRAHFRLLGCLLRICQWTSLQSPYLFLFFLVIVLFWVFLFLPLHFNCFVTFLFCWGCVDRYGLYARTSSHSHVASFTLYSFHFATSLPQFLPITEEVRIHIIHIVS